tara:strand:- start:1808 stop:3853 length:2046 start_codon:yes stop_codon:yes gene_type:complete
MHYKRLIPIVLLKDGLLVRSQLFKYHQAIGDPIPTIKRLSDWSVDELILLNIGHSNILDSRRDDKWHNIGNSDFNKLINSISKFCFAPLTVGGKLNNKKQVNDLFESGADKCVFNTSLFTKPELIKWAVEKFGSQAIVGSLDIGINSNDEKSIFIKNGTEKVDISFKDAINYSVSLGIGELLISSINKDGSGEGYDKRIINELPTNLKIPLIINSGATKKDHFVSALKKESIQAVAASNIFYFRELSYPIIKKEINRHNKFLRDSDLLSSLIRREPNYDRNKIKELLSKSNPRCYVDKEKYNGNHKKKVRFCKKCFYPNFSATPMQFDDDGVCMGCRVSQNKFKFSSEEYQFREEKLKKLFQSVESSSEYDCIISVSGGKDSYYQTYFIKEKLKLNPLLVTYNGNNYSEEGWLNLTRMKDVFDCDHIIVNPSVKVLKKLNRLSFITMGDMNWHNHVGIFTTAQRIAVKFGIPFVLYGEHGYADLCGQFSNEDYPEMNYRERLEHHARGFDWNFFVGLDNISSSNMNCWKYPSDNEILELGLRQIYLGNYIPWEANNHLEMMIKKYNFKVSSKKFERTYRVGSNLDDIHENGVHDYLKYIKFGYGRCTDHASKDIRANLITREEGINLIKKMDHIKPSDLKRWLDYVDISEEEFDRIADHFRDPRVWMWNDKIGWYKDNIHS